LGHLAHAELGACMQDRPNTSLSWQDALAAGRKPAGVAPETDICLIVEGCYPFVRGGVSAWMDWLMRGQPHLRFSMVSIWPLASDQMPAYDRPPNLLDMRYLYLHQPDAKPRFAVRPTFDGDALAQALLAFVRGGSMPELARVDALVNPAATDMPGRSAQRVVTMADLLNSQEAWKVVQIMYDELMPQASFLDFFWAWRALFGGLFAVLKADLPTARVYHTISTGYGGLTAARAAIATNRPALITEHGIYTNERRIEILMANWIADTVDKGLSLHDPRFDLRDMWINAFEAYAKACYEGVERIITLYGDNQILQRSLGAKPNKLQVIANGMDWTRFASLPRAAADARPTVALIGRVVPIKDVKTYITAVSILRRRLPDLRALILGPTDEDPDYHSQCVALAQQLGLENCIEFTGNVAISEWLSTIHVVALTSLSEAQPLVLLEAGAAGVPCVTTNVGSCAEILLGRPEESPPYGHGGIITGLVAPAEISTALLELLTDHAKRAEFGENLRARVKADYSNQQALQAYKTLYDDFKDRPARATPWIPSAIAAAGTSGQG
jgi:polysaccharide biosynthesis protein PelF